MHVGPPPAPYGEQGPLRPYILLRKYFDELFLFSLLYLPLASIPITNLAYCASFSSLKGSFSCFGPCSPYGANGGLTCIFSICGWNTEFIAKNVADQAFGTLLRMCWVLQI